MIHVGGTAIVEEIRLGPGESTATVRLVGDPESIGRVLAELQPIIAAEQQGWLRRARQNGQTPSRCGGCGD